MALILAFGPVSGAHFNPAVTLADAWLRGVPWRETPTYIAAQIAGAFAGVATAHWMFGLTAYSQSVKVRSGAAQVFSEFVATFGLLAVILGVLTHACRSYTVRGGRVHYSGGVLVYGVDIVLRIRL